MWLYTFFLPFVVFVGFFILNTSVVSVFLLVLCLCLVQSESGKSLNLVVVCVEGGVERESEDSGATREDNGKEKAEHH